MPQKRKIRAVELAEHIRSGMADSELMEIYQLSSEGLQHIFKQLVEAKVMTAEELYGRSPAAPVSEEDRLRLRRSARIKMELPLRIYEIEYSTIKNEGRVRDISATGVGVRGIGANPGEIKTFLVVADKSLQLDPIVFQAECRWEKREGAEREHVVGFEIRNIPDSSAEGLERLIERLKAMLDQ